MALAAEKSEAERLEALDRMELLDTACEPEFDELVEIAAAICEVPMSLVTLVDDHRQWFKAAVGMAAKETPREVAFCHHAIMQTDLMIVEDATHDARFVNNPLVTGDLNLRFYAGMPISSPDGFKLGTLCVLDRIPRKLNATQIAALKVLGRQVNARMELRLHRLEMERALKIAEEATARSQVIEQRFMAFMNSAPFMSFLKDSDGRYVFYNRLMADRFAVTQEQWIGMSDAELFPVAMAEVYRKNDLTVLHSGKMVVMQEETLNQDGTVSTWRSYKFPCNDMDGAQLLGGISVEVTKELKREAEIHLYQAQLEEANKRLHELAATDSLTGIANRRVFDERLMTEFSQAKRKKRPLAVMVIDLDNFKLRNDSYGHEFGDRTLKQFAALLQALVRETDLAARYGGEEFVVLLPETDEEQAKQLAERICQAMKKQTWDKEPLTISIGIASVTPATASPQRLLSLADEALYAAKRAGKDGVVAYGEYYKKVLEKLEAKVE